jgi:hypothetical protein
MCWSLLAVAALGAMLQPLLAVRQVLSALLAQRPPCL